VAADLWSLGAVGIEELAGELRAAFADHDLAARARALLAPTARLETVDDRSWLGHERDRMGIVEAGRFVVHPPWLPVPPTGIGLSIDPGEAFGSGSHPSTRLALDLLGRIELNDATVIDVGCGTGVLSIAAARLGATVHALDTDQAAISATRDNAARNAVAGAITVELGSVDVLDGQPPADVLLVNVTIDVQETVARLLPWSPRVVIASGILDGAQVARCVVAWARPTTDRVFDGEWVALSLGP
jgi:ribosomal protein L11 methyltransferase